MKSFYRYHPQHLVMTCKIFYNMNSTNFETLVKPEIVLSSEFCLWLTNWCLKGILKCEFFRAHLANGH